MDEDWEYEDVEPIEYMPARFQPGEQHWGYGMGTKVEGVIGQKLKKIYKLIATEEEKFKDNMIKISLDFGIKSEELTTLLDQVIDKIPDLKYKSPIGILLGFLAYKNNILRNVNKFKKFVNDYADKMRYKYYRITKLDIIRYAHLISRVINPENPVDDESSVIVEEEKYDVDDDDSDDDESEEESSDDNEIQIQYHEIDIDEDDV